jgi:YidC/Oxa1 family membrane protein insertase
LHPQYAVNMENKNTIIGTILLGVLVLGMFYFQSKVDDKEKTKKAETTAVKTDSTKAVATATTLDSTQQIVGDSASKATLLGGFATSGDAKETVIENAKLKVTLSSVGGNIKSVEIKDYKTWNKKPLILFTEQSNHFQYIIDNNGEKVETNTIRFETQNATATGVSFIAKAANGAVIEQSYTLSDDIYKVNYNLKVNGIQKPIALDWKSQLLNLEHDVATERTYSALYYKYNDDDVQHLDETKDKDEAKAEKDVEWISFKQQFFNATLLGAGVFKNAAFNTHHAKDSLYYVKRYDATAQINTQGGKGDYKLAWYFGPNKYDVLKKAGPDLENIIKLGYDNFVFNWIKYITRFLTIPTFNVLEKAGFNYGIIILLLTLLLKLLLTPLTWSSIKSAAHMKAMKPELDALKAKYGDDQQKIAAEQMTIYREAGVNPFGGCLPMLLQLPILMSMYLFFPNSIELRQQSFLWATDLSSYDSIYTFSTALPLIGDHISLFTILMTITSIAFAAYSQANSGMQNTQPGMQYMPYIMPLFLMFMFNSFPAALTYYYLLQNVISIGQQALIQKFFIKEDLIRAKIEHNKKNPKEKSKWQQKFEDIQKQQQEKNKK